LSKDQNLEIRGEDFPRKNISCKPTPVAGMIFETKNRAIFLERLFWRGISGEALMPVQLCSHKLAVEWIHFPRIRTFVEKRFHGLFSKKKRSKSGVFLRFQEENTFWQ